MVDADKRKPQGLSSSARRLSNDRLAENAVSYRFAANVRVPFWYECGDPDCDVSVPMTLPGYRDACATGDALLAPNHVLVRAENARRTAQSLRESAQALKNEAKQARRMSKRRLDDGDIWAGVLIRVEGNGNR